MRKTLFDRFLEAAKKLAEKAASGIEKAQEDRSKKAVEREAEVRVKAEAKEKERIEAEKAKQAAEVKKRAEKEIAAREKELHDQKRAERPQNWDEFVNKQDKEQRKYDNSMLNGDMTIKTMREWLSKNKLEDNEVNRETFRQLDFQAGEKNYFMKTYESLDNEAAKMVWVKLQAKNDNIFAKQMNENARWDSNYIVKSLIRNETYSRENDLSKLSLAKDQLEHPTELAYEKYGGNKVFIQVISDEKRQMSLHYMEYDKNGKEIKEKVYSLDDEKAEKNIAKVSKQLVKDTKYGFIMMDKDESYKYKMMVANGYSWEEYQDCLKHREELIQEEEKAGTISVIPMKGVDVKTNELNFEKILSNKLTEYDHFPNQTMTLKGENGNEINFYKNPDKEGYTIGYKIDGKFYDFDVNDSTSKEMIAKNAQYMKEVLGDTCRQIPDTGRFDVNVGEKEFSGAEAVGFMKELEDSARNGGDGKAYAVLGNGDYVRFDAVQDEETGRYSTDVHVLSGRNNFDVPLYTAGTGGSYNAVTDYIKQTGGSFKFVREDNIHFKDIKEMDKAEKSVDDEKAI